METVIDTSWSGRDVQRPALSMESQEEASFRGTKRKLNDRDVPVEAPRRIKALQQDVVNKIAAGEIIIAPVHALKELIENAVDAGSTALEILVRDGGLKLLQITDNGRGINREDLPILCERFTTSKLKEFKDLESIDTYGFRGEALASISHIAHLQITTKVRESSCAWRAHYADGKLTPTKPGQSADPKPCAGRQGTQITVEDLFYNVPTRRRAFRSASEEYNKILDQVGKYAIHCSGVAFSCKKHGDASMGVTVSADATTVDRIRQIHGSALANELVDFRASSDQWGFKAEGWISNANYNVKKTVLLIFINHRSVESTAIKKAVDQTYSLFLPKGGHPFCYLSLQIEPHRVDVNVHPTKREVHFLNEDEIVDLICEEIRVRLGKVDTSRNFMTQSILPGVTVPTISPGKFSGTLTRSPGNDGCNASSTMKTPSSIRALTSSRPYENNLVRTDASARKITSMFQPLNTQNESAQSSSRQDSNTADAERGMSEVEEETGGAQPEDSMQYVYIDREPTICRLGSVKELRAEVREQVHSNLTDVIATHTFVGIVDHARRLAAIQSRTKLFLVDYGLLSFEYFYQLSLTDFGNFGLIRLEPPLPLRALLTTAADIERDKTANLDEMQSGSAPDVDWDEVVAVVLDQLLNRRDMLSEYFGFEMDEEGNLHSLPLLMKGYLPSMAKLPHFLLGLGPYVEWDDEKGCFQTFLKELARWYVPEAIPTKPPAGTEPSNVAADQDSPQLTARRDEISGLLENVLFPAFKSRLIATKGLLEGIVEVANLKGLYRVFERC